MNKTAEYTYLLCAAIAVCLICLFLITIYYQLKSLKERKRMEAENKRIFNTYEEIRTERNIHNIMTSISDLKKTSIVEVSRYEDELNEIADDILQLLDMCDY